MNSYAEYCPISMGVEVLGDRWTPLVIRELIVGASGFNDIHRGIPRISRTLLAQRLRQLERQGLVIREVGRPGRAGSYTLTPAGAALTPIVWALGTWAAEWKFGEPEEQQVDGLGLLWRLHQRAIPTKLPTTRTVVHFLLSGEGGTQAWLELEPSGVTVCRDDPGHEVDLVVEADTRQLLRWFVGRVTFREVVSAGHVRLVGPSRLIRAFPTWFDTSAFSEGLRRAQERELTAAG